MPARVEGSRILLTGATGGLGAAIARALASRGATLVLSSRRERELAELAAELPGEGHVPLPADLAEPGAADRLAVGAGEVDILVANAGLPGTGLIWERSRKDLERVLRVNLEVPVLLTHALLPAMLERGSGQLVYVSSLAGKAPSPRSASYNASKFGLRGFALALRQDLRGSGVGASLVLPGFVRDAGMFADAGMSPPPGMGTASPAQVGEAVVRAIERDRAELPVAPRRQRALTRIGYTFPGLAALAQRGRGEQIATLLAERQSGKR